MKFELKIGGITSRSSNAAAGASPAKTKSKSATAKRKKTSKGRGGFTFAKWKRSASVAPAPESAVFAGRVGRMASNGVTGEEGVEEMETEMSPEPNGTCV